MRTLLICVLVVFVKGLTV